MFAQIINVQCCFFSSFFQLVPEVNWWIILRAQNWSPAMNIAILERCRTRIRMRPSVPQSAPDDVGWQFCIFDRASQVVSTTYLTWSEKNVLFKWSEILVGVHIRLKMKIKNEQCLTVSLAYFSLLNCISIGVKIKSEGKKNILKKVSYLPLK